MKLKPLIIGFLALSLIFVNIQISAKQMENNKSTPSSSTSENRYAVIVGVCEEAGDEWMMYTARDFYNKINNGYWDEIKLIYDFDATTNNIINGILWLSSKSYSGNNVLLFYYAGHSGSSFISTLDGVIYDTDLKRHFALINPVNEELGKNKLVMIFETCYAGRLDHNKVFERPLTNIFLRIREKIQSIFLKNNAHNFGSSFSTGFNDVSDETDLGFLDGLEKSGRVILTSSNAEQQSCRKYQDSVSVFTYYLMDAIDHGYRNAESIFYYARPLTEEHVETYYQNRTQNPRMSDKCDGLVRIV